ncbi:ankyrin repeat-containing domain protein, partial [Pelagophyceae sp. CCMP2097]
ACRHGSLREVEQLIHASANVDEPGDDGKTPLLVASEMADLTIIAALVAAGVDVNKATTGCTALMAAADHGSTDVVAALLAALGVDSNQAGSSGFTALHIAATEGRVGVLKQLLSHGAGVNLTTKGKKTALGLA